MTALSLALVTQSVPEPAYAGPPPFSNATVRLTARDQDVATFIREFFGAAGISVTIASPLKGKVNGRFSGPPAQVWARIARAFNLVAYHDGSVVTVYNASEVASRAVSTPGGRASELVGNVGRARLVDGVNRVTVTSSDSVLATGVPRFLDQVQQLAGAMPLRPRQADVTPRTTAVLPNHGSGRIEPYELRVFYLRYARADDTTLNAGGETLRVPGVGTILSRVMGDGAPVRGLQAQYGRARLRPSQPGLRGQGLDSIGPGGGSLGAPEDDEYLGLMGDDRVTLQSAEYSPLPNGPRISTDPSLNVVIVRDRPENMPAYEGLVRALDIAPQIVELEATIIDLNIDRLRELGINWRFASGDFSALFGGDIVRRTGDPAIDTARTGSANRGLSLSAVIGADNELIARVSALEEKGAAKIISRPQLVTLSNVEAVFDRTRTFYVRVAGDRQVDLFNVTAGTMLRVNPHVLVENGQPRIRMVVSVEDGAILNSQVDDIPIVERASVNTQALIAEGESLLLGGLTVNSDIDNVSQLPLLGDIPVIGNLFKTRSKRRQRTERLFLITPRITRLGAAGSTPAAGNAGGL